MKPALVLLAALLAACGGAATPEPAPATAEPTASATAGASTSIATEAVLARWTVTNKSKATVRVREQLANVQAPSDAVLETSSATGTIGLKADGSFTADSKITVDLTTLASDSRQRDQFIKDQTLQTRQFPTAVFVPTKAVGLPAPLPASGDFTFTLTGNLTVHGKTKEATFDLTAKRSGADLTATATASPAFKFADFGMSVPRVFTVLSIVDDIRLSFALVATQASG